MKIPDLSEISIFVAGDLILDRYLSGPTNRLSPEAPVPVLRKQQVEDRLGGAANVALNIRRLGAQTSLAGLVGTDSQGKTIQQLVAAEGIVDAVSKSEEVSTITKLRLMSRNQQLLRIDTEEEIPLSLSGLVSTQTVRAFETAQALVISDYGKGSLAQPSSVIHAARAAGIPVLIDPKGNDYEKYFGATLLTPNLDEFQSVVGTCHSNQEVFDKAEQLRLSLDLDALVVTMSERGMAIIEKGVPPTQIPTRAREVFDVTGAGDTVIATLSASLAGGSSILEAAHLANLAAGIVVGKLGTASVSAEEMRAALYEHQPRKSKTIVLEAELLELVEGAKNAGERIVMTNGCFDLLHPGHLTYLQQAASEGDRFIIAVNDDDSVSRLKGPERPINSLNDRMQMLAGIKGVDWVCAFKEDTPKRLISTVLPDLLIKGGDYRQEDIAGYDEVTAAGGAVKTLEFIDGYSSTELISRIKQNG